MYILLHTYTKNQLTFWLEVSTLSFLIALFTMIYTSIHFYIKKSFSHFKLHQNHHRENYKLIELADKQQELILNYTDSNNSNLNWKHSKLTN